MRSLIDKKAEIKDALIADVRDKRAQWDFDTPFELAYKKLAFFNETIQNSLRFENSEFLVALHWLHTYGYTKGHLSDNVRLYRGRIYKNSEGEATLPFLGYNKEKSFVPPRKYCKSGRANYEHKPCLYAAEDIETAVRETKASDQQIVSVAEIKLTKPFLIIDLCGTKINSRHTLTARENLIIKALMGYLFAEPTTESDNPDEYILTQFLAEYFHQLPSCFRTPEFKTLMNVVALHRNYEERYGADFIEDTYNRYTTEYDGIAYMSRFTGNKNYCIFNYHLCEPINSKLYVVHQGKVVKNENA